jgi:hypothetical protein
LALSLRPLSKVLTDYSEYLGCLYWGFELNMLEKLTGHGAKIHVFYYKGLKWICIKVPSLTPEILENLG